MISFIGGLLLTGVVALIVTAVLLLVMGRVGDMVIPAPAQQMFIV